MHKIKITILVCLCVQIFQAQPEKDLFDKEHSLLFAKYLFKSQQFVNAAGEFERLSYLHAEDDSLKIMALECYLFSNEPFLLRKRHALLYEQKTSANQNRIDGLITRSFFKEKLYDAGADFSNASTALQLEQKIYFEIFALLFKDQFKDASKIPLPLQIHPEYVNQLNGAINLAKEARNVRQKSPLLAGTMSAIIPGSGKFYTKDWKDGLIGFFTVGATAYQSVRGFQRRGVNSAYGWVFGGMATGFYLGNIYGSVQSAKRYNKKSKQKIKLQIENRFNSDYLPIILQ